MDCNIVLSGSGIRFPYFLGALKAIEFLNFKINAIAGTSGGSIVAAFYSFIKKADYMYDLISTLDLKSFIKRNWTGFLSKKYSLYKIDIDRFYKLFDDIIGYNAKIEDSEIPLKIVSTNISDNKMEIFTTGLVKERVLASISAPLIFPHVEINGNYYVDGAVCKNLLADAWIDRDPNELTILIYFKDPTEEYKHSLFNFIESILQTSIACNQDDEIEDVQKLKGNNVITIPITTSYSAFDFDINNIDRQIMLMNGFQQTFTILRNKRIVNDDI